ncbi:hypothetical protein DFH94DRAFT_686031 [Russula ochroleuca]|uniref:Uncharacterized protein n=1 Tax=Russula ochroleuca TaxID=152965 RepID=A0A9P5JWW6_9AGAM|nr:hypothetical protein DFH94DRAFT_686031 [Russula ochroleuca]
MTVTKCSGDKAFLSHNHYSTAVICRPPPYLPAELRHYTIIAKGYIPAGDVPGDVLLDAVRLAPFPGDPSLDDYDDYLPEFFLPLIFGVGSVSGSHTDLLNGQVCFPVLVAEYVRGCIRQSTILCILNKASARWANVPVPTQGSVISFMGACLQVTLSRQLSVEIENIMFCSSPSTASSTSDSPLQPGPSPPPKKSRRKYPAFAPPRVPVSNGVTPSVANENLPLASTSKSTDAPVSSKQDIGQHDVHEHILDKDCESFCPTPVLPTETVLPTGSNLSIEQLPITTMSSRTRSKGKNKA